MSETAEDPRLAAWRRAASAHDALIRDPTFAARWQAASWNDEAFAACQVGLRRLQRDAPEFFAAHDYAWVFDRAAYRYAPEPLYQLVALEAAAALHQAPEPPLDPGRLGALSVHLLGAIGIEGASPFLDAQGGYDFIALPYGWDDVAGFALGGFAAFCGLDGPPGWLPLGGLDAQAAQRTGEEGAARALPFWRSLALRAVVARLAAEAAPEGPRSAVEMDAADWDALGRLTPDAAAAEGPTEGPFRFAHDMPARDAARDAIFAASAFAVAHEVAHAALRPDLGLSRDAQEAHADVYALKALWAYEGSLASLKPLTDTADGAAAWAAACFFLTLRCWGVAYRAGASDPGRPEALARREAEVVRILRRMIADPEAWAFSIGPGAAHGFEVWQAVAGAYLGQFESWLSGALPDLLAQGRARLQ